MTLFLLLQAFVEPIKDQDGRMTWDLHARYMRAEQTASPLALRSPAVFVTHPQYPPLLPLLQTVALEAVGADPAEDRFVRPLYALFFPAAVLLVLQAAAPLAGAPAAAAAALVASALPALSLFDDGGPSSTYSDAPLGALFGGACLLLLRARSRPGATLVAALLLSAAVLAKNEGTLLAGGLLLAWSAGGLFRRAWKLASPRRLLLEALPWLAAIGARFLLVRWRAAIPNRWDEGYEQLSLAAIRPDVAARKLLAALPEILRAFADWRLWSVAWLLVALLLVVRGRTVLRAAAPRFVAWAALLPPAVGLLAYAVTPWGDVAGLVRVTWARFLLQGALPGLVLLALLLREPRDAGRSRVSRSA